MPAFEDKVKALAERATRNNIWRGSETINLIPSENTPSPLVKLLEISDPAGRYAEHETAKGREVYYYQGTQSFIRPIEEEVVREMMDFLGATLVEPRPTSGAMANGILYQAITRHLGRKINLVLANDLIKGGHLTHRSSGNLFQCVELDSDGKEKIIIIPTHPDNPYKADERKLAELILDKQPELSIFGKSMILFPDPVPYVRELVNSNNLNTIIMKDDAHPLGLNDQLPVPLQGAHFLTGSTHKTYFGTQRGIIASSLTKEHPHYPIWTHIKRRAFPGNVSNHHLGTLLGLLMASYEMNEFKGAYQAQVRSNAKTFARALKAQSIQVEGEADGFTETHQVLINVRQYGGGIGISERLENNNLVTNYQALPYDGDFKDPSGIRMGVQEMTRYGMKEKDFEQLAVYVADAIKGVDVKDAVIRFRKNFLQMQYTIEPERGAPLAAKLLSSIMPDSEYAKRFAENFMGLVSAR